MSQEQDSVVLAKTLRSYNWRLIKYRGLNLFLEISLQFMGFKKTIKLLDLLFRKVRIPNTEGFAYLDSALTIFNRIKETEFLKGKCLSQSLALQFILRRRSIASELVVGTYIKEGVLFAHAWLERENEVLNDHPYIVSQYKVLLRQESSQLLNK